jgi:hypothetical protein
MVLADLQVGMTVRDLRCPTRELARIIRISDGQAKLEFPDGRRTWADPHQVALP